VSVYIFRFIVNREMSSVYGPSSSSSSSSRNISLKPKVLLEKRSESPRPEKLIRKSVPSLLPNHNSTSITNCVKDNQHNYKTDIINNTVCNIY